MQYLYFGTVFSAILIYLLAGLLLLMQRKMGERSRTILAGMTLLSTLNYIGMLAYFYQDPTYGSGSVMDVPFLLVGIFVITIYFMYPIEVVSPGWITWKRLLKMYTPAIGLSLFYYVTLRMGVEYPLYDTIGDLAEDIWSFQVIFRIILALLIFAPTVLLYYVPFTRRYNNTDHKWMRRYITTVTINMIAYLVANIDDSFAVCSAYVVVSILCSMYIIYQELYVRLIRQPMDSILSKPETEIEWQPMVESEPENELTTIKLDSAGQKELALFKRLESYMNSTQAWQDPDLSTDKLASALYTNRTSLLKAIQYHGYSGYVSYVNGKRVAEFIQIVNQQGAACNYRQTFFDVGFRSKATALRNFKDITGVIPSEYFQKQILNRNHES